MANSVTTNIPPSTYYGPQTVTLQFGVGVDVVSYTVNGVQPTISEYIAYDTLTPPNPFIAVTQDGRGRVVYDGGFPKFYNESAPAPGTPFSGLTATFKYLYNALNWTADPVKVAQGNKSVLILGDVAASGQFAVKGTDPDDFFTSFTNLCATAGFTPTFRDIGDYAGGQLNPTLAELSPFACIIVVSSTYFGGALITNGAVQDIQTFRSNGGGVIIITDHGPDIPNIESATPPTDFQFFATANKLAVNFGAYFTGLYDRSPVNVGFLRSTYGDHPLYNGMSNEESIYAGASESRVVVATFPTYTQATVPPIPMNTDGRYTIRILAKKADGTIETFQYIFAIVSGGVVEIRNAANQQITQIDVGWADNAAVYPIILGAGLGTITGQVLIGGVKAGDMAYTEATGSVVTWLGGVTFPHVDDGNIIRAEVTSPFSYYVEATVTRFQPDISNMSSTARIMTVLKEYFSAPNTKNIIRQAVEAAGLVYKSDFARNIAMLVTYLKRR